MNINGFSIIHVAAKRKNFLVMNMKMMRGYTEHVSLTIMI